MKEMDDKKFLQRMQRDVARTLKKYSLISEGDTIAVALSGGKDSLMMLEALAERRKRIPFRYNLISVHVDIKNIEYKTDTVWLREFSEKFAVPFHVIESEVDLEKDPGKSKCFICSWMRRKELFRFCREMNCTKLAMGHQKDDAVETLIMNMIFNGAISSMPPKLKMFDGDLEMIRPLILLSDESISRYARLKAYPGELKRCPYGDDTRRNAVKEIIESMTSLDKNARNNIFSAMTHIHQEYLPPAE